MRYVLAALALFGLSTVLWNTPQAHAAVTGSITGTVMTPDGKPAAGFTVKLYKKVWINGSGGSKHDIRGNGGASPMQVTGTPAPSEFIDKLKASMVTDANGKFTFQNVEEGDYLVRGGSKSTGMMYNETTVSADNANVDLGTVTLVKAGAGTPPKS